VKLTQIYRASVAYAALASFTLILSACSVSPTNGIVSSSNAASSSYANKIISAPTGVVAGSITLDGKPTSLRYVYARGHAARRVDIERLGLHHGETIENGVISVLLSNVPLSSELVTDIVGDTPALPGNLIGILLTIDPSREYHWESQFLVDSERISLFGYTTTGGEAPAVEDGRIQAKLALRNQDAIHQRSFLMSFDSLLSWEGEDWEGGVRAYDQAICGSALQFDAYRKAMPGRWASESWLGTSGVPTDATLTVNEEVGDQQFLGTFHFVVEGGLAEFDEEVVIDCVDSKVHVRGAVVPGTRWAADTMVFDLLGKRLVGTGKDEANRSLNVVLKKIR
jgi:hypothetical protein